MTSNVIFKILIHLITLLSVISSKSKNKYTFLMHYNVVIPKFVFSISNYNLILVFIFI